MAFNPKVSVVIPVYNGSNFLAEAIESALAQTYSNLEVVVVNDGSNDEGQTEAIALSYGDSIRYFAKENGGVSTALNKAIDEMSGDYLSWLSHDDLYSPDKVRTQVDLLETFDDPANTIIYSDYSLFNVDTGDDRRVRLENTAPSGFRCRLLVDGDIHGCTLLIPRTAFDHCGKFNAELKATQDYDMWFRLAAKYAFVHVPESLVTGRIHNEQLGTRIPWRVEENVTMRKKWIDEIHADEVIAFFGKPESVSFAEAGALFAKRRYFSLARACIKRLRASSTTPSLIDVFRISNCLARGFSYGLFLSVYRAIRT